MRLSGLISRSLHKSLFSFAIPIPKNWVGGCRLFFLYPLPPPPAKFYKWKICSPYSNVMKIGIRNNKAMVKPCKTTRYTVKLMLVWGEVRGEGGNEKEPVCNLIKWVDAIWFPFTNRLFFFFHELRLENYHWILRAMSIFPQLCIDNLSSSNVF